SNTNLHQIALDIAGKTHDIKKDNQRILAGLSNLIKNREFSQYMNIKEIIKISIDSNKQYALSLEKKIKITSHNQRKKPKYYVKKKPKNLRWPFKSYKKSRFYPVHEYKEKNKNFY